MISLIKNNINILIVFTYAYILYAFDIKDNYLLLLALTILTIISINKYYVNTVETIENQVMKTQGLPAFEGNNKRKMEIMGNDNSKLIQAPFKLLESGLIEATDRSNELSKRKYGDRTASYSL